VSVDNGLPPLDLMTVSTAADSVIQHGADRTWSVAHLDWDAIRPELLTDADRSAVRFLTYGLGGQGSRQGFRVVLHDDHAVRQHRESVRIEQHEPALQQARGTREAAHPRLTAEVPGLAPILSADPQG